VVKLLLLIVSALLKPHQYGLIGAVHCVLLIRHSFIATHRQLQTCPTFRTVKHSPRVDGVCQAPTMATLLGRPAHHMGGVVF
tara:strand:+ start:311 stop:556 length:246 start_codon:yes stop_codon:yes gene_type:complete